MGALTTNRKRLDECSNQIDTRLSKKPKISSSNFSSNSSVSRLNRYPEPARKLPREVHAPCRVLKFGSSTTGFRNRAGEESSERRGTSMWNLLGRDILRSKYKVYERAKELAFSILKHVKPEPKKKQDLVWVDDDDDSSDVEFIENENEIRSSMREHEGLAILLEPDKEFENGVMIQTSSSPPSGLIKVDPTDMSSLSMDQPYRRLYGNAQRNTGTIYRLRCDIDLHESIWHCMQEEKSFRKLKEVKKPEALKKPVEDTFHQPFARLTEEEAEEVKRALSNSNRRKILVTHENSNIQITGDILQCLRKGAWLNDEVINVYLELLKERESREPKKFLNSHFFSTFFYKKLIGGRNGYDYKSVRRWTTQKKLGYGLVECDKIFVPIHKEVHWCLAVINKKDKKFQYLDSLGGTDQHCLDVLARYYVDEVKDKSGQDIDVNSWEHEFVDDLPAQQNGFDCGVFMIKYADFYSRGMGLQFSQENMPYFRIRTAKEILRLRAD